MGIKLDETSTIHITIDQARSLWHELGAVLQSEEKDAEDRAAYEAQMKYPDA